MLKIGFLGLGKMGAAMAPRLIDAGHHLVVWNRTVAKLQPLLERGAERASTPAILVDSVDIIITVLSSDTVTLEVFQSGSGLLSGAVTDKLFIDMSTLRPDTVLTLAKRVEARGGRFVDAPVSGTVGPAEKGQLLVMCGASDAGFTQAQPILDIFARRVVHAGPVGQGALLKLVVNLPLAVYWSSLAEAIAMGTQGGLDLKLMLETIQDSSAALAVLQLKIPNMLGEELPVAFDVENMEKDMQSMLHRGSQGGVSMPTSQGALDNYSAAKESGLGSLDAVEIVRFLTEKAQPPTAE